VVFRLKTYVPDVGSNRNRSPGFELPESISATWLPFYSRTYRAVIGMDADPTFFPLAPVSSSLIGIVLPLWFALVWSNLGSPEVCRRPEMRLTSERLENAVYSCCGGPSAVDDSTALTPRPSQSSLVRGMAQVAPRPETG